jgi:hypothetical protein
LPPLCGPNLDPDGHVLAPAYEQQRVELLTADETLERAEREQGIRVTEIIVPIMIMPLRG